MGSKAIMNKLTVLLAFSVFHCHLGFTIQHRQLKTDRLTRLNISAGKDDLLNNLPFKIEDVQKSIESIGDKTDGSSISKKMMDKMPKDIEFPDMKKVVDNLTAGELGTRGEAYVVAQASLVLCILFGTVPLIGDFLLPFVCGPGFVLAGLAIIVSGVIELGDSLSPFPVPVERENEKVAELKTSGAFEYVRHPLYCGLILMSFGFGVWTESSIRFILTAMLYYALSLKIDFEEKALLDAHPEAYKDYMNEVPGRLFPVSLVESILNSSDKE